MNSLNVIFSATFIWFAIIVSPGPNFLVISRLALAGSRRSAIGATLGIAAGSLLYATLTMFGLSIVVMRFAWLGDSVRILGGAYLVWLGFQAWRASGADGAEGAEYSSLTEAGATRGFRAGLLTEITNPKGMVFFLGLFAAAVPADTPLWAKLTVLLAGVAMEIGWYGVVSCALSSGAMQLAYRRAQFWIDRAVGTLLVVVGVRLALDVR